MPKPSKLALQQQLPRLSNDQIVLAYQISDFVEANGRVYQEVPELVGYSIDYVTKHYRRPLSSRAPAPTRRTNRAASAEPPTYPYQWSTDLPTFRRAVSTFAAQTQELREGTEARPTVRRSF